ncbi:MAG: hypothetical protein KC656_08285, partial [Myxococcales bacterium]|nr:hypothetical protein [Myxococcales bacterium]
DLQVTNRTGATATYLVEVVSVAGCATYDLTSAITPGTPCPSPDVYEPNETYATALTLTTDTSGLNVDAVSPDFFAYPVPAGSAVTMTATTAGSSLEVELFDPAGNSVDIDGLTPYDVTSANLGSTSADYTVGVWSDVCTSYDLTFATAACATDDALEPNQSVATAITTTLPAAMTVLGGPRVGDDYVFVGSVQPGQLLTVDVLFTHVTTVGDIDAELYDAATGLEIFSDNFGGASVSDNEVLEWFNGTGAPVDVVTRVFLFSSSLDCTTSATYTLDASILTP